MKRYKDIKKINTRFHFAKYIKILLSVISLFTIGCAAGCASNLTAPFDLGNLYYEYSLVSDSDGEYIILTKHIVSESDVTIPDTIYDIPVRGVGESAFADDTGLISVTMGKYVEFIGNNAFGGCSALQSVELNVSMSDIGSYAFQNCTSLASFPLNENTVSIGRGAFYGCAALSDITIPEGITAIGGRAFAGTPWLKAKSEREFVTVGDGILIDYNGEDTEVTLPKRVKQIAGAFAGRTDITSVTLSTNVISIGDMAFMGCSSLKSVNIPTSVTDIGKEAFYGCTSINSIYLGDEITSIGKDAFQYCGADLYVTKDSAAEKYCIDNGIIKGN